MCPRSASASVFILIILSRSSLLFSARAFNNRFVVCVVIMPTFVSVACKLDNLRSLPFVCRSRRPQISGLTFGVISRSQFDGLKYFSDLSLRLVSSSLLSHLKLTILASFSDTFGAVFSVSVSDCAISSSKESLSPSSAASHVELSVSLPPTFCLLLAASRSSASDDSPVSEVSVVAFRFWAGSAALGVRVSPLYVACSNLSESPIAAMLEFSCVSDLRIETVTFPLPFLDSSMRTSGSSLNKASSCREDSSPVPVCDIFFEFSVDRLITQL